MKTAGGCATPAVFLAQSDDGYAWTVLAQQVLVKGATPGPRDIVYRSTFEYDPPTDAITFWFAAGEALDATLFRPAPAPLDEWP